MAHLLQLPATQAMLGYHDPLAVVVARLTDRIEQTLVALTLLSASLGGLGAGVSYALAGVVASAVAALGLAGSAAILASDRRACVRDLIIEGRGDLRLAVVERETETVACSQPPRRAGSIAGHLARGGSTPGRGPAMLTAAVQTICAGRGRPGAARHRAPG